MTHGHGEVLIEEVALEPKHENEPEGPERAS